MVEPGAQKTSHPEAAARRSVHSDVAPKPAIDAVDAYVTAIRSGTFFKDASTSGSFESRLSYYRNGAPARLVQFRAFGVLTIAAGLVLVALVAFRNLVPNYDLWLAGAGVVVSALSTLNSFYRFDLKWRGAVQGQLRLEHLRNEWERAIVDAKYLPQETNVRAAQQATERYMTETAAVVEAETNGFFSGLRPPSIAAAPDHSDTATT
jgi:hypothetical protein